MPSARLYLLYFFTAIILSGAVLLRYGSELWPVAAWFLAGTALAASILWFDENVAYPKYQMMDGEAVGLVSRSALFLLAYIPLSVYLLTSSGSLFGMGLIVGIGLQLALEMFFLRATPDLFVARFLRQVRRDFSLSDIQRISIGFAAFVGVVTLITVL
jgi:hypothetical protein